MACPLAKSIDLRTGIATSPTKKDIYFGYLKIIIKRTSTELEKLSIQMLSQNSEQDYKNVFV